MYLRLLEKGALSHQRSNLRDQRDKARRERRERVLMRDARGLKVVVRRDTRFQLGDICPQERRE